MSISWTKIYQPSDSLTEISSQGFSSVELSMSWLMSLSDDEFKLFQSSLKENQLMGEIGHHILPKEVRVTKSGFNLYVWMEYLKQVLIRFSDIGGKKLIWNDGRSRVLPLEGDTAHLQEQAVQFLNLLADYAEKLQIEILIEPLSPRKTNYINSVHEAEALIKRLNKKNLGLALSFREFEAINFDSSHLSQVSDSLKHFYWDNPKHPEGNRVPPTESDSVDYQPLISSLKKIDYKESISLIETTNITNLQNI